MPTWIALVRGINVGGRRILPMKSLVALVAKAGGTEVESYIQSGNVIFRGSRKLASTLGSKLEEAINAEHGFAPKVLVLGLDALDAALHGAPYQDAPNHSTAVHLYFLARAPQKVDHLALNRLKSQSEAWELREAVFYLYAPDGVGRSKLAARAEQVLGVDGTARNWRTALALLNLARASDEAPAA